MRPPPDSGKRRALDFANRERSNLLGEIGAIVLLLVVCVTMLVRGC